MKEQDLDRLLNQQKADEHTDQSAQAFQKRVRRAMNRTMYSRILSVLVIVVLLGTGICFGISAVMDAVNYDPGRENSVMDDLEGNHREFSFLLEETINMYYPGMRCIVPSNEAGDSFTAKGFGRYDVNVSLLRAFDYLTLPSAPTDTFRIRMSKLDTGYSPLSMRVNEFIAPDREVGETTGYTYEEIQQEMEKLPDSAWLDVSVSFGEYLSADEVAQLMRSFSQAQFQWLALKGQEAPYYGGVAGGMHLYSVFGDGFSQESQERYPGYFLPQPSEITGADLERCLRSRLQLLLDHKDFVKLMSSSFTNQISQQLLEERLENAKNEWACYGIRLMVGREDLEKLSEQLPISQIVINDVKVSRFQR